MRKTKVKETEPKRKVTCTVEHLKNNYLRLIQFWSRIAEVAVDDAFRAVAADYGVNRWYPNIEFKNAAEKESGGVQEVLDDLEAAFWEQDMGWEGADQAYKIICDMLDMYPDKVLVIDPLGQCGDFGNTWNEYQRQYALHRYGIDISFDN